MADIHHEIKIESSPEKIYKALTHLNELKAWHTAHVEGKTHLNDILKFEGKGKPEFDWKITELVPNKKVAWECIEGPGDSKGTKAHYQLSKIDEKHTLLEFSHTLWPDEKGNFRKCNTLWAILIHHLKNYVETGIVNPCLK